MAIKDIKEEARKKLALNMHQAIAVYTVEFTLMITLIALIVMSWVALGVNTPAAIVMICYGVLLALIAFVGVGMANFAMVDYYLASYRCKPYNIRRLGETLARSNVAKIFLLNLQRTVLGFLLLLCLIVPGVIYLIRTSMANYLLIANPKMTAKTAIAASNKVMSGKTGAYFSLCMSLMGWYLLGIITLGLGFIFIMPYTNLIKVVYYKRNLQGDKAVYTAPPQPVSPQAEGAPIPSAPVSDAQRQEAPQQSQQPVVMPIDTLEDDDLRNMKDAMRGFGDKAEAQQEITVPEVPIMPVAINKNAEAEPIVVPIAVEPNESQGGSGTIITHSIDGTNIVETERVLTTKELEAQAAAQQTALDGMYVQSEPKKPVVDYFSQSSQSSPDDFVTGEVHLATEQEPVSTVIQSEDAPVISDSEFDAFLKAFDNETIAEAKSSVNEPQKPSERNEQRTPNREAGAPETSPARERRVPPRRPAEHNGAANDRAERVRREREERLQKLKK